MRDEVKVVGGQTFWQLLGKIITSISTLVLLSLISRFFGEEGTGVYTLAVTYLAFFNLAADLGVNAYGLRLIEKSPQVFHKILAFRFFLSLLLVVVAIFGGVVFLKSEPLVFLAILFGSLSIVGSALFTTTNLVFQSKFRYDLSIIASSLSSLVSLALIYFFIVLDSPLFVLTAGHTIGWIVCAFVGLFLAKRFISLEFEWNFSFIKKMFVTNWPISVTLLLNVVYFRIDTFIISFSKGIADVGIYNFAYQFFSNALVFPTFMMNALYPLFLKTYEKSEKMLLPFMFKSGLIMGLIGLSGTFITYIVSPFLIPLVAGENGFKDSITVLQILSFSFPAFFLSAVLMWGLVTVGLNKRMLSIYLIGLSINFAANFYFIPQYSYIAAAWVTVFCEYIILLLQVLVLIRYFMQRES